MVDCLIVSAFEGGYIVFHIKITESREGREDNVVGEGHTTTIYQKHSEIMIGNGNTRSPPLPLMTINLCNLEQFPSIVQLFTMNFFIQVTF